MIARLGQALARQSRTTTRGVSRPPLRAPAARAAARATLDVPAVIRGFPCGPGRTRPGSTAVDPVEESDDLPVQRPEHLALRLSICVEIAKTSPGHRRVAAQGTFPNAGPGELPLAVPVVEVRGAAEHVVGVSCPNADLVAVGVLGDPELVLRGEHGNAYMFL
jgi:hypothetical protein